MSLTIDKILQFGGLVGANFVAGQKGKDNVVVSISVLEIAEPQISRWVMENELYITSFYAIRDNVEMQKIVIETLYNYGCCGLVICHTGICLEKVDEEVIKLCDRLGFPLILAKSDVSYIEIINPIISRFIIDNENAEEITCIKREYLDIIVNENDTAEALKKLTFAIKKEASYYDIDFNCLYSNKNDMVNQSEKSMLKEKFNIKGINDKQDYEFVSDKPDGNKLVKLVKSNSNFFGFIVFSISNGDLEEINKIADEITVACALLISRKNKISNLLATAKQEYISDLLIWNFRSDDVAVSRGEELGFNILDKNTIIVVNINVYQLKLNKDLDKNNSVTAYIKQWILPNIANITKILNPSNFVVFRSDTIILFLENKNKNLNIRSLCEKIIKVFLATDKSTVSIGVSRRFTEYKKIAEAYMEAFTTAILGREYLGDNLAVTYEDVLFFRYIKTIKNEAGMQETAKRILAPLIEYDKERGSCLVETLKQLIFNNGDVLKVADKMFIHRNTLLYRKNKITELLGSDPFTMPDILNFICALYTIE